MAFNPGGTDYRGYQSSRDRADEGLTSALDAKGRADKQARIKKSGERSGLQKLISAGARGAAAYYTGGMSEQMGAGGMIDEAMLGTDSEGRAVQNEYGNLVGAASQIGDAMSAEKGREAATKLDMQSRNDAAMQQRLDLLDPSGELGMEHALKVDKRNKENTDALLAGRRKSFAGLFQKDIEGLNYEPTTMGDWESKLPPPPARWGYKGKEGR